VVEEKRAAAGSSGERQERGRSVGRWGPTWTVAVASRGRLHFGAVSNKKNAISIVVFVLCAAVTLATVMNVFGDNTEVEAKATAAACWDKKDCKYAKRAMVRTPLGQTFTFEGGGRTFDVVCRRAAIVFGDYTCKAEPAK